MQRKRMVEGTPWYKARRCDEGCNKHILGGGACEIDVLDASVNRALIWRGKIQLTGMIVFACVVSGGIAALPPY